jgi:hypothetical protein
MRGVVMILTPTRVASDRFTYTREGGYTAEVSDLGIAAFGRVYDDACDTGLTLVSQRTGREVVFVVEREDRDAEGDVTLWKLEPADRRLRRGATTTMTIFND